jgi:hypothetical protein
MRHAARLRAVDRLGVRRAEHHQRRPPPAVQRILGHRLLFRRALGQLHHDVVALARVEGLFLADADHGARIRAVGAAAQRDLVDDGRAVHQPADGAHVGPAQRRVVEDARILGLAGVQGVQQFVARDAQRLGGAIQIQAVAGFVLDLGQQNRFALERGRARDPVAFRQLADDLGMGVLGNLAHQRLAVGLRHPVLGLDLDAGVDAGLEGLLFRAHVVARLDLLQAGFYHCAYMAGLRCVLSESIIRYKKHDVHQNFESYRTQPVPCTVIAVKYMKMLTSNEWIAHFLATDPPRSKSLVMTIFGDAIAPHGARLWLGSLIELVRRWAPPTAWCAPACSAWRRKAGWSPAARAGAAAMRC